MEQYDYVVIGAGSAGCMVARRLSENEEASVLVLEAGGPDELPEIHSPQSWPTLWGTEVDRAYETTAQEKTAGRVHDWPRGKVLDGTSSLNAMVYIRGHRSDFDAWAYEGNLGWDYESVLPLFRKMEDFEDGESEYHGAGGPLHASAIKDPNSTSVAFIEGCREVSRVHRTPIPTDFSGKLNPEPVSASDEPVKHSSVNHHSLRRKELATMTSRRAVNPMPKEFK